MKVDFTGISEETIREFIEEGKRELEARGNARKIGTVLVRPAPETVQAANTSLRTTKSVPAIVCQQCGIKADRVGAQDNCDVYICEEGHITRCLVGTGVRMEWAG